MLNTNTYKLLPLTQTWGVSPTKQSSRARITIANARTVCRLHLVSYSKSDYKTSHDVRSDANVLKHAARVPTDTLIIRGEDD